MSVKMPRRSAYTGGTRELDKHVAFPAFLQDYLQLEHGGIEHIVTDERI